MEDSTSAKPTQQEVLTLHHLSSSQSNRVLWAIEELVAANGLKYNLKCYKRIKARAPPELKEIHPMGKSPILVVDGPSTSDHAIRTESRLVLRWLSESYGEGLWTPESEEDKQRDAFWEEFGMSSFNGTVIFAMVFDIIPSYLPWFIRPIYSGFCNSIAKIHLQGLDPELTLMESALTEERPWFAGAKLGLSDFNISWPMDVATQRGYFDAKKYPKVAEWHRRVHERPAYKRAVEKGGSYDLVKFDL